MSVNQSDRMLIDNAALAAVLVAHRQHGTARFRPTNPQHVRCALRRAVVLGWLWEPEDGVFAITHEGIRALEPRRKEPARREPAGVAFDVVV